MTAIWSTPRTWAVGELLTAALLNQQMRDNLDWLKTPAGAVFKPTATSSITATTFTDVWTLPAFTTTGGKVMVACQYALEFSIAGMAANLDLSVDGASQGGTDGLAVYLSQSANQYLSDALVWYIEGLAAGSHTIKLRAKVNAGTLTFRVLDAASFRNVKAVMRAWEDG